MARETGIFEDEGWRLRKDGTRFWAHIVITRITGPYGELIGFSKITRDLTERRRITALEDEGRRIANFLALLGHKLRNPLAPISNAVALLERENSDSKALRATREIIGRQLRQLNRLVDDLLDVGRITSGKIELEARPVRFIEALHEAIEAVRPLIDRKSHVLDIHSADDPWVIGDRARIIQILSNLIGNAAKFTPADGRISVRVAAMPASTEVRVIDNGPGIAPQHLHKVLTCFPGRAGHCAVAGRAGPGAQPGAAAGGAAWRRGQRLQQGHPGRGQRVRDPAAGRVRTRASGGQKRRSLGWQARAGG